MAESEEHIDFFIKVDQLVIARMFQIQLLDKVLKVVTTQHALHEWL